MNYRQAVMSAINTALNEEELPTDYRNALHVVQDNITIKMSAKMTRAAGSAGCQVIVNRATRQRVVDPRTLVLKLSTPLMARADDAVRMETITHEIAHLVDFVLRGKSDHGYEWARIHRALGGSASRYHTIDRTGLEKTITRYEYLDTVTGKICNFTKGNHQKVMRYGATRYRFIAEVKRRGKEIVARHEAQYATAACRSK